jgi:hypothetical protein
VPIYDICTHKYIIPKYAFRNAYFKKLFIERKYKFMKKNMQGNLQNKKDTNPIENETVTTVVGKRGRQAGERPKKIIVVNENYQLDLSDGMNIDVEKLVTRTKDDTKETYQDWENNGHFGEIPNALLKIVKLMDFDKIPDNQPIPLAEYTKIHKQNDREVFNFFKSGLEDYDVVEKQSKVKKTRENKR